MNILFTVCGRAGSKGCKNKNIRDFLGNPLFYYTLNAIKLFAERVGRNYIIKTAVSTDSAEFQNMLKSSPFPDVFLIKREAGLAQDDTPKMFVIADALKRSEAYFGHNFEIIVDLDITSPIRTISDITRAVDLAISNEKTTCTFSVTKSRRNPFFNMVKVYNGRVSKVSASAFVTRQEAPEMFDMNASIYVYKKNFLLSGAKSPLEGIPSIIKMKDTGIIDIDDDEDFELMQSIAEFIISKEEDYKRVFTIY